MFSGVSGKIPGHYDPGAERQLGGLKKTEPKYEPEAEIATKAWAQFASTAGLTRPALSRRLRSRNPSLLLGPGNGITVSTKGEALSGAH